MLSGGRGLLRLDDAEFKGRLLSALRAQTALPYLFVGSGMSRRYLGLPTWEGLLRVFTEMIGANYDYLAATADGELPEVARLIAEEFHETWWNDPDFAESRALAKDPEPSREAALKIAVSQYIQDRETLTAGRPGVDDEQLAAEIASLQTAVVDGVITTNYYSLSDQLFPSFKAYVGQDDLLLSDAQFIAESYKIHGSAQDPTSLILTATDYENFRLRGAYLAAKLLTIFAEHPVIFLGYSITDKYIQEILVDIARAIGPKRLNQLEGRLIFVEWDRTLLEPEIAPTTMAIGGSGLPILRVALSSYQPLFDALSELDRPFPARVLRDLREFVFNLVADPTVARESVVAIPIDSPGAEDYKVVFGVGALSDAQVDQIADLGFRGISREDLAHDVLAYGTTEYPPASVLELAIPSIKSRIGGSPHIPVWKYLNQADRIRADGSADLSSLPTVVSACARVGESPKLGKQQPGRFERDVQGQFLTPLAVRSSGLPLYVQLDALLALNPDEFKVEELRTVLVELDSETDGTGLRSAWWKAVCRYDYLRYGRPPVA